MVLAYKGVIELPLPTSKRWSARALRPTTSAGSLAPPKSHLFSVLAPQWWKELSDDVRTAETLTSFRKRHSLVQRRLWCEHAR
ncbi:unnamed protein product [Arctogadus glacialis]